MFASEFDSGLDNISFEVKPKTNENDEHKSTETRNVKKRKLKTSSFSALLNNPTPNNTILKNVSNIEEPLFCDKLFKDMVNLHPHMIANLEQTLGITRVTAIQDKTISELHSGKDMLVRSQTGSGKTLAYAIPIIENLHKIRPKLTRKDGTKVLIVLPTRELALQTYECFVKLTKPYTWLVPGILIGGEKRKSEKARIRKGITILICTPGRVLDHAKNTTAVSFGSVQWFVIDEADRLLDLGYEKDITSLIQILDEQCEHRKQTVLLSATLTPAVERLACLSLNDPVHVDVIPEGIGKISDETLIIPNSLRQHYVIVPAKLRLVILSALILDICVVNNNNSKVIVFVGTHAMVDYHAELLSTVLSTINFYKLHGNMTQVERTDVFKSFRSSQSGVLFCSDVGARGLDLPSVDWIIQYNAPITANDYVHRVGRTARVGHRGDAVLFLAPHEIGFIQKLQDRRIRMEEMDIRKCLNSLTKVDFYEETITNPEYAASALQARFETAVLSQEVLHSLGCQAFMSWARFYATYPKDARDVFSYKALHLGHYAKSFALKDRPKAISSVKKPKDVVVRNIEWKHQKNPPKKFMNNSDPMKRFASASKRPMFTGAQCSEFGSGLRWTGSIKRKKILT